MKLWTIQDIKLYNKLIKNKVIYASEEHIEDEYLYGYNWMVEQMKNKIGESPHACFPIWAWYQYESKYKPIPDLRSSGFLEKGSKGVRIKIDISDDKVLLSDFELWHTPLSYRTFIGKSEKEGIDFDNELKNLGIYNKEFEDYPITIQNKIIKSWDKIFDLNFDCKYYTQSNEFKSIQATFWELRVEDIVKVDHFIAK